MSGQIPAGDVAGGEGKREGEHEEVLRYLWMVLEGIKAAGGVPPTEDRTGGRWRTAAGSFRRAKEGRAGPGGCSGAQGSLRCGQFREERSRGTSSTRDRAHGGAMGRRRGLYARGGDLGCQFIGKRIDGEPLVS
jgi:hypothetical protein